MLGAPATLILADLAGIASANRRVSRRGAGGPAACLRARREIVSPPGATYIVPHQTSPRRADKPSMLSPCTKVCTIDVATGLCAGCARTLAEIAAWGSLGEAERARIVRELPGRRRRTGPPGASSPQRGLSLQVDG